MRSNLIRASVLVFFMVAGACASGGMVQPAAGPGATAPGAAVEQFLQLANNQDFIGMGWVFGTERGPILRRDPPRDVERRMAAIANIMKHDSFVIRAQAPVPGRVGGAFRFDVVLTNSGREYPVPFTTVRGPGERWYIEDVRLESITTR